MKYILCLTLLVLGTLGHVLPKPGASGIKHKNTGDGYHSRPIRSTRPPKVGYTEEELTAEYWQEGAQATLAEKLLKVPNTNKARNVIMFLGDGMSVPTLATARAYMGQSQGLAGENSKLSWEDFSYSGFSKTYCVDYQVADSACSATAYLSGVKANMGTIGVTGHVALSDCTAMQNETTHVHSIAKWSQDVGKSTGIVTTTRVTHASPAGVYANTANRDWEADSDIIAEGADPTLCRDIAWQLINGDVGSKFEVIMGGGRKEFLPKSFIDEEGQAGARSDGLNLIEKWQNKWAAEGKNAAYVWNKEQLQALPDTTQYLLGLFESSHCQYHLDADPTTEPTLADMTRSAIEILKKNPEGFFLFVEGGRIDQAHHDTKAQKALDETVQMSDAVQAAVEMVNMEETLIVITSDHAHTMSYAGYPLRGNPIIGIAGVSEVDNLPYATMSYANGLGYLPTDAAGNRHDLSGDDMEDKNYIYPATVPAFSETHGGDDVGVFAEGPWAHLFTGTFEQNVIPHMMAYASCVGTGETMCSQKSKKNVA